MEKSSESSDSDDQETRRIWSDLRFSPDREYSPDLLQMSWNVMKEYRRAAEFFRHELLKQRAIDRCRDAWFESLEEKGENKILITSFILI